MSSEPTSSGEELSEYVRRPTRTAGDLSEVADASPGITQQRILLAILKPSPLNREHHRRGLARGLA